MTSATATPELLTVREAAARYKVHEETIRKWIRCDLLPVVRVGPWKLIRIRTEDLESFTAATSAPASRAQR